MNLRKKKIPLKELKPGDTFNTLITPNQSTMASFKIIKNEGIYVTVEEFGEHIKQISTENAFVEIPYTEEELKNKYFKQVNKLKEAIHTELDSKTTDIGFHEMWNGWIDTSPLDFTLNCIEEDIHVIGYFKLDTSKISLFGVDLDIGVVAEDKNGNRFWCHANSEWFDDVLWEEWKY